MRPGRSTKLLRGQQRAELTAIGTTGTPVVTAVIKSPETFLSLIRDPSPYNFAESYVKSRLDLEGDLFQAMDVANAVEGIQVTPLQKLRLLLSLWKR